MFNRNLWPGFGLAVFVAVLGFVAKYVIGYAGAEVFALVIGIVVGNLIQLKSNVQPGIQFSEKKVLGWAIALMGLQLNFSMLNMSWYIALVLLLAIAVSMLLGRYLPKRIKVNDTCGYMIGVGHAICGASAIAAVSPFLSRESHETGVAVGVVNLLGTVGMLILPVLAIGLDLSAEDAGLLMGGSLQAVGNAVGAGYAVGEEAGQVATLIKLGRVLMLGPVVLFTAFLFQSKSGGVNRKKMLPGFVLVFLALLILTNIFSFPPSILSTIKQLDKALLAVAMAGIGMQIKFADLKSKGPRALILGTLIFTVQVFIVLLFIYAQDFII